MSNCECWRNYCLYNCPPCSAWGQNTFASAPTQQNHYSSDCLTLLLNREYGNSQLFSHFYMHRLIYKGQQTFVFSCYLCIFYLCLFYFLSNLKRLLPHVTLINHNMKAAWYCVGPPCGTKITLACQGMDPIRPLKVCFGIWHQYIPSRSCKFCKLQDGASMDKHIPQFDNWVTWGPNQDLVLFGMVLKSFLNSCPVASSLVVLPCTTFHSY